MAESYNSKRISFGPNIQREFIVNSKKKTGATFSRLAILLGVSSRTLYDWKREKFSMPLETAERLATLTGTKMPTGREVKEPFWYANKGAQKGGRAVYEKYGAVGGSSEYRKKKWFEWWEHEGKLLEQDILKRKPVRTPRRDQRLAEFVGIMIGDGGMTSGQVTITLNSVDDAEYCLYVVSLLEDLFHVKPSIYKKKGANANTIVISRKELVAYCESLGLKIGNKIKQGVDIPAWIKQDSTLLKSCVRGLIDTDGSVFTHHYRVKKNTYCYKKLSFSNHAQDVLMSVLEYLKSLGFSAKMTYDAGGVGREVRLNSYKDTQNYFRLVGTSNPKHSKKILELTKDGGVG